MTPAHRERIANEASDYAKFFVELTTGEIMAHISTDKYKAFIAGAESEHRRAEKLVEALRNINSSRMSQFIYKRDLMVHIYEITEEALKQYEAGESKQCPDCEAPLNEQGGCSERCNGGWPSLENGKYEAGE